MGQLRSATDKDRDYNMSSMRRSLIVFPLLLVAAEAAQAQTAVPSSSAIVPAAATASGIDSTIAYWRQLRQSSGYSFNDYARFLIYNPGWPGEDTMRRNAERAMRPGEDPATVTAFFRTDKPTTGNGYARLAESLLATGRPAEALAAAKEAWLSADLSATDEASIYARFGSQMTRTDHDQRVDALLFDKRSSDAYRMLPMVTPARQAAFSARIAMQSNMADAEKRYQAVIGSVTTDAGLMMDRARYLRGSGWDSSAQQLFARQRSLAYRPADVDRFLEMMLMLAGAAAESGQYTMAYNIARQVDDLLPPGTDITRESYGIRDKYTSLTWLAGSAAYGGLRNPANAIPMFERYSRGGKSAQVTTKGLYWAGRAATAAGRLAEANSYFSRAAAFPELFYGQLALERMGRSVPRPNPLPTFAVTPAQRAEFNNRRLVQATRRLASYGSASERSLFARALGESLTNDGERTLAVEFGQQIGRQDISVWVARAARNEGSPFYVQPAYPSLPASVSGSLWSLAHGITRQESSFDRYAVSHAGARGMMQLMPGTAREQAGKMGVGYDPSRLTSDPNYNIMLGSAYFQRMLNTWDGSIPLAVASYNAGAGNVRKWVDRFGDPRRPGADVLGWIEQIPFSETKGYVQRVIENSVVYDSMNPSSRQQSLHVSRYLGRNRPA